jgi:nucleotidyltransferase AbiEii toxin of type IV toxin-antitoxin system
VLESLNEDFKDALRLFADSRVDFLVVGAYALALHGAPRASGDIDLFVRPSPENSERVHAALARFGAPLETQGVGPLDFARPGLVYQIGLPPRRIDVLTELSGVSFEEAYATRELAKLDGRTIPYIGREAFIRNKQASGRPKDLADVARLQRAKH